MNNDPVPAVGWQNKMELVLSISRYVGVQSSEDTHIRGRKEAIKPGRLFFGLYH